VFFFLFFLFCFLNFPFSPSPPAAVFPTPQGRGGSSVGGASAPQRSWGCLFFTTNAEDALCRVARPRPYRATCPMAACVEAVRGLREGVALTALPPAFRVSAGRGLEGATLRGHSRYLAGDVRCPQVAAWGRLLVGRGVLTAPAPAQAVGASL
jgi:hypothetical protein